MWFRTWFDGLIPCFIVVLTTRIHLYERGYFCTTHTGINEVTNPAELSRPLSHTQMVFVTEGSRHLCLSIAIFDSVKSQQTSV